MQRLRHMFWPIAILLIVKLLFLLPLFRSIEYKAQDSLFRVRGPQELSEDIVIIAIDDATDSALDMRWPYPREYHAKLLDNLFQLGVKQVVFDLVFTESAVPDTDSLLAQTADYHRHTIFAGKVIPAVQAGEPSRMLTPIPPIMAINPGWGIVNINPDLDNVIREYTLFELFDGKPIYSLGLAAFFSSFTSALIDSANATPEELATAWDDQIIHSDWSISSASGKNIPIQNGNRSLINYYGAAGHFPYISYATVLDDSSMVMPGYYGAELNEFYDLQELGILEGKRVLIGATIDELHDKFPTPFGGDWTPGVEIHANFLEMAIHENYLNSLHPLYCLVFLLILLFIFWAVFRRLNPQFAVLILIALIVAQYLAAYILFSAHNFIIPIVSSIIAYVLLYVLSLILHYLSSLKEKQFIRNTFQQYMAPELVNELLKSPGKLSYGGTYQQVSVLFSDIRSFTTYTENHSPTETVNILKEYLTAMVSVIIHNKGTLDKFVGDEIMALYGTPLPLENHALYACKTALEMREKLSALQDKWRQEGREIFEIGIGVNTGGAIVGNLGSEQIFDYTAIGDTINLGARLESINKEYDTAKHIIISEFTYEQVKEHVDARFLAEVKVKGKNKAVNIYELIGLKGSS